MIKAKIIDNRSLASLTSIKAETYDELYEKLSKDISIELIKDMKKGKVVKCKYNNGIPFASTEIVPPFAIIILDENKESNYSLRKKGVKIHVEIMNKETYLRVPIFVTQSFHVYEDLSVLQVLKILGDLDKQIHSMKINHDNYILEQMVIYDRKEIENLLNHLPKDVKGAFKTALYKNLCEPLEPNYHDKVLVNPFFPIGLLEELNAEPALKTLIDWMFDSTSTFIRSHRLWRCIRHIIKDEFESVPLIVDILKRTMISTKFFLMHAYNISHLLELLMSQDDSTFRKFRYEIMEIYIPLYNELSLQKGYVEFFEESLASIDKALTRVIELSINDLLIFIGIITLIPIVVRFVNPIIDPIYSYFRNVASFVTELLFSMLYSR